MGAKVLRPILTALVVGCAVAAASGAVPVAGEGPPPRRPAWVARLGLPEPEALRLQEPAQVALQGLLTDPISGQPLPDGPYTLRVALYRQAAGGEPFWEETHEVHLQGGLFDLLVGSVRGDLTPDLFYQPAYVGLTLAGDVEMSPRQPLVPVPEALVARTVQPGARWTASLSDPLLSLENEGEGVGMYVASAQGTALAGQGVLSDTMGISGLNEHGDGVGGFSTFGRGGYFASALGTGAVGNSIAAGTAGLEGLSNAGVGVRGQSETGAGGYFHSTQGVGLQATASNPAQPALLAEHTGGGTAVSGTSLTGQGVEGYSSGGVGVSGVSDDGAGGFFRSTDGPGLRAVSSAPTGAMEVNNVGTGPALWAESLESHGVEGHGALSPGKFGGYFAGHGGVRAQGVGGPALLAQGPIASTEPTHLWVGGLAFRVHGADVTAIPQPGGGITLTAPSPLDVRLYATLPVPAVLHGQAAQVQGLRVQYRTTDPASYVDATRLGRGDGAGGLLPIVDDGTDHAATTPGAFYEPPLLGLGHEVLDADNATLGLELVVHLEGPDKPLALYGVRLTLGYPAEGE